jgi:hypothetical protein
MFAILHALGTLVVDLFKSRSRLEAENLFLRHQLTIALRRALPRRRLRDRCLIAFMVITIPIICVAPRTRWATAGRNRWQ